MRRLFWIALLVQNACGDTPCERLSDAANRCELSVPQVLCDRLPTAELSRLAERAEALDCPGLRKDADDQFDVALCSLFDRPCPQPLFSAPEQISTRGPVLLVGGIVQNAPFAYNTNIVAALLNDGVDVHLVEPASWAPTETRAEHVRQAILRVGTAHKPINLVCYAVGGIDCRFALSPGGLLAADSVAHAALLERVASITTIATPHRGTAVAREILKLTREDAGPLLEALGFTASDVGADPAVDLALEQLLPERMRDFNERVPDAENIHYFSWAGVSHLLGLPEVPEAGAVARACEGRVVSSGAGYDLLSPLLAAASFFAHSSAADLPAAPLLPNDGLVDVKSAKWGNFRGCLPADHYDLIGQIGDSGIDANSGFSAIAFYQNLVSDLGSRGL